MAGPRLIRAVTSPLAAISVSLTSNKRPTLQNRSYLGKYATLDRHRSTGSVAPSPRSQVQQRASHVLFVPESTQRKLFPGDIRVPPISLEARRDVIAVMIHARKSRMLMKKEKASSRSIASSSRLRQGCNSGVDSFQFSQFMASTLCLGRCRRLDAVALQKHGIKMIFMPTISPLKLPCIAPDVASYDDSHKDHSYLPRCTFDFD